MRSISSSIRSSSLPSAHLCACTATPLETIRQSAPSGSRPRASTRKCLPSAGPPLSLAPSRLDGVALDGSQQVQWTAFLDSTHQQIPAAVANFAMSPAGKPAVLEPIAYRIAIASRYVEMTSAVMIEDSCGEPSITTTHQSLTHEVTVTVTQFDVAPAEVAIRYQVPTFPATVSEFGPHT